MKSSQRNEYHCSSESLYHKYMNLNYFFFYIGSNLTIINTDYATGFEMRLIANNSKATCL